MSEPVSPPTRLVFHLPRQYQHYAGAVDLATAFARGLSAIHGPRQVGGAGFLVATERLFESFIERSLDAALAGAGGWQVTGQERSLFANPVGVRAHHRRPYFSKPDNVVRREAAIVLLIDAKYKRFKDETEESTPGRPSNGDLYQMAAACVAHDCTRALLVYPRTAESELGPEWIPVWWQVTFGQTTLHIGAVGVPLSLLPKAGLPTFDAKLAELVRSAVENEPSPAETAQLEAP